MSSQTTDYRVSLQDNQFEIILAAPATRGEKASLTIAVDKDEAVEIADLLGLAQSPWVQEHLLSPDA